MRRLVIALALAMLAATPALAQVTGPSYNAPYRAFVHHEFGATLAFPDGGDVQIEGQYRFGTGTFDIGLRGGVLFNDPAEDRVLAGIVARNRVITHTEQFPLDGAIVFGGGLGIDGFTDWRFPVGLSLGRRVDIENSDVSLVIYGQPTLFVWNRPGGTGRETDAQFAVGFGVDVRLSSMFDIRVSGGLGDNIGEGVAISAVWIR